MLGSSNNSFIPKRNPAQKERPGAKRQVFVGTIIIRILFLAALIAAAGAFIYQAQLKKNLDAEVTALDGAIQTFNEAEMQRVLSTNARLKHAEARFESMASMSSLLRALERSTVGSVQISQLSLERIDSNSYEVKADMKTKTFDSVMFQRSILEDSDTLVVAEITDVTVKTVTPDIFGTSVDRSLEEQESGVTFSAVLSVATEAVPHTVSSPQSFLAPVVEVSSPVVLNATTTQFDESAEISNVNTI